MVGRSACDLCEQYKGNYWQLILRRHNIDNAGGNVRFLLVTVVYMMYERHCALGQHEVMVDSCCFMNGVQLRCLNMLWAG